MEVVYKKVKELKPVDYNPRYLSIKAEEDLTKSIILFGFVDPVLVNTKKSRRGNIIGGHQRYKIAIKLIEWLDGGQLRTKLSNEYGLEGKDLKDAVNRITELQNGIPCIELDLTEKKERELNIRLNKNTGDFDFELLKQEFEIGDLMDYGFESYELGIDEVQDNGIETDESKAVVEIDVSEGEVWKLGDHYILVGDDSIKPITDTIKKWNKLDAGSEAERVDVKELRKILK